MPSLYPFTFHPVFKERIWGGRNLETLYGKSLPPDKFIGESWEITDRPEGISLIANGPFAGRSLRWLMETHRDELLGVDLSSRGPDRFPLLIKILDAQEKLSLQVHPPAEKAMQLGGEPKTEMWYIAHATPEAALYVGLKRGVTRQEFEARIQDGTVAQCFHRISVRQGDVMFLPSGRVHAIGAGNVIFEIQQNSDTTYRVFDWNRVDDSGKPRELHVAQSLASIDFNDFEPGLVASRFSDGPIARRELISSSLFIVEELRASANVEWTHRHEKLTLFAVLSGTLELEGAGEKLALRSGQFSLVPGSVPSVQLRTRAETALLTITLPLSRA